MLPSKLEEFRCRSAFNIHRYIPTKSNGCSVNIYVPTDVLVIYIDVVNKLAEFIYGRDLIQNWSMVTGIDLLEYLQSEGVAS